MNNADEWNRDGLRDKLFGKGRRKIEVSREDNIESFRKVKGEISAKYIRKNGRVVALKLSSDEPFIFSRYPELDEDSCILEENENEITYSLGERGQEFYLANNILNYILRNNPGTFTYAYKKRHYFYDKERDIEFGNASKLEGDKIYVNRVEGPDKINYRFISKKRFFSPKSTSERNGFELKDNGFKGGIGLVEYSLKKDGAEALVLEPILDEVRRINRAEFSY